MTVQNSYQRKFQKFSRINAPYLWAVHFGAFGCYYVKPPPGQSWYCGRLMQMMEWHSDWELPRGKYMNEEYSCNEEWVHSSLHQGHCHCFHHSLVCAKCVGIAPHGTAAYVATKKKHIERIHCMVKWVWIDVLYSAVCISLINTLFSLPKHMYLVYVKRMDAHLSGSILWKNQTGELALPCTASWTYSSSISSVKRE